MYTVMAEAKKGLAHERLSAGRPQGCHSGPEVAFAKHPD